jgi:hypothetical protein
VFDPDPLKDIATCKLGGATTKYPLELIAVKL